jgi:transposase, IS5 family
VVETNVEYPTDTRLLFDAIRKAIELLMWVCTGCGLLDWKDDKSEIKDLKKLLRKIQRLKHSRSKEEAKKEARKKAIIEAHQEYLEVSNQLLQRVQSTLEKIRRKYPEMKPNLLKIEEFIEHAERQMNHIERRVVQGETIPHKEKVFSIFEPHTEWICKGKVGVPMELGLKVGILEDQHHFILHHHVMQQQTDEQITVSFVEETQTRFPRLDRCSFDQGFYAPAHQSALAEILALPVLPKKGKRSKTEQAREQAEDFVQARCQHAAVESAINALEVHGLDRCPDRGLPAFKRYVALAVVARNIQVLGVYLRRHERDNSARHQAAA